MSSNEAREQAAAFNEVYQNIKAEVGRMMVGQEDVIEGVLTALLAGGHVLLEGVPGLGKTMLVRSLGEAVDLKFSRIQFTPDMMPADIQGTSVLVESDGGGQQVQFREGPLVANLVLADEINRATPKTQSALLEAMQEKQITVGNRTIKLAEPYCVMATQNPVEQEGTYPLPEAQLDRFLFKLVVGYPKESEYQAILNRTTSTDEVAINHVSNGDEVGRLRETVRSVPVPEHVQTAAVRLVMATQPGSEYATAMVNDFVMMGSSPRGAQSLLLGGKVKALLGGRFAVSTEDVHAVAVAALRHRVMINFHGQSEGITTDAVLNEILANAKSSSVAQA
ncbi:MAG: AAA domain-containing protein [Verrucomicrobiaceae bacterium]|jgi:MoxR-like ATPase|nr:MoxR family ATPase [Verrucomicrobiales bacterium]NCF87580.1 AAA domain-containing protein [Verrucomicrobiaceae bacterium]NCF94451.1 AAA domain-containing protein [Verrucomicrobiaceae bacterium]